MFLFYEERGKAPATPFAQAQGRATQGAGAVGCCMTRPKLGRYPSVPTGVWRWFPGGVLQDERRTSRVDFLAHGVQDRDLTP